MYLQENIHTTRMKKPRKSCFANVMKIRVCSVNMSLYHRDKDFTLCKCRVLKSSCTNVVKARLYECSVQPCRQQRFQVAQV